MGTVDKLTDLQNRRAEIEAMGGSKKVDEHHQAGKKTARERIALLLDEGSFVEVDAFVQQRCGTSCVDAPADGVVTGYGTVDGRLCYVYAQDATVIGGSLGEMHAQKICKILDMAMKMGAPVVALCDSLGARIQEGVSALKGFGDIVVRNAHASGVIPQITAVLGPCAGGATFSPAISDFVFMVEKTSRMYVTGPAVTEAQTGEKVCDDFGYAEFHAQQSGVAQFTAESEEECIAQIRKLISYLPSNNLEEAPYDMSTDEINRLSEQLTTIVPDDSDKAYDVKAVINDVCDAQTFMEVSKDFAKNIVVGFARLNGNVVGVVANQANEKGGALDRHACDKATRFINFCDSFNIPLVTFTDVSGYVACVCQEKNGIIRSGAKLMYAFAEATVPKINVIIRKAYGAAYVAMNSKPLGADWVMAWPTAEIAVMNPEGAANLIFEDDIANSKNPITERDIKVQEYKDKLANPFEAAKLGQIDDIIEPDSTRPRIIAALEMLASKRETRPAKKHGNMPV